MNEVVSIRDADEANGLGKRTFYNLNDGSGTSQVAPHRDKITKLLRIVNCNKNTEKGEERGQGKGTFSAGKLSAACRRILAILILHTLLYHKSQTKVEVQQKVHEKRLLNQGHHASR